MSNGFFSISNDGRLVDVSEQAFATEDSLQGLIAMYPRLLSGDDESVDGTDEWLFVAREIGIPSEANQPDRWSLDHLFLDREGVPTLVEVKRSEDTRIRREVVGQFLDYAANASVFWPMETIRDSFFETCKTQSLDQGQVLSDFLGGNQDPETFWELVTTNLQAGRLRLVFLADQIPVELRRIIEFLNKQMDRTEVIGIEVKQYGGEGFRALTSRTVGRTSETIRRRNERGSPWDEERFFGRIVSDGGNRDELIARKLLDWSRESGLRILWGRGRLYGSFYAILDYDGIAHHLFSVWTDSHVEIQFAILRTRPRFQSEESRMELLRLVNEMPSVELRPESIEGYPRFQFSELESEQNLDAFFNAINWAQEHIACEVPL